jgi:repressor LexA
MSSESISRDLEDRRHKILACIEESIQTAGLSPSYRDIMEALGIPGLADVKFHIDYMEREGWIRSVKTKDGRRKTGKIQLTEKGRQQLHGEEKPPEPRPRPQNQVLEVSYFVLTAKITSRMAVRTIKIPVLSVIAASFGEEIISSDFSLGGLGPDSCLIITQDMLPAQLRVEDLYALEVRGDSMIDAGIESGDFVIVKRTQTAENGDMCVVWIDEKEATVKYFYKEEMRVRLEPANPRMAPRLIGPDHEVKIQGRVVLVVRA